MEFNTLENQEADGETAMMVRADKLALLYDQSFPATFVSVVAGLLLCLLLWQHVNDGLLLGWLVAILLAAVVRLVLFILYFRTKPAGKALLAWERPYIYTLGFASLMWGSVVFVMPVDSPLYQSVIFFFLIGMAGGAISTYSALRFMALSAMLTVMSPTVIWLLWRGQPLQLGMAAGALLFMIAALRATKVLSTALHNSFQLARELENARDRYEKLAQTDFLTGLNNRRAFYEHGQPLVNYCERNRRPLSAMMLDVDHFKSINDAHGHVAGDAVLHRLAQVLATAIRKSDVCGRMGGEEFAVLLPDTTMGAASSLAEKLRLSIEETPVMHEGVQLRFTASIGVAADGYDIDKLLHCADMALYRAKAAGRNRVVCVGFREDEE
jgi:diguanylate cyclase (GGDEF)-like protein